MRSTALLICAATLALAGCGRSDHEEEAPIANEAAEAPPPPVEPMPANLATPPAEVANATPPAAPPPEISDEAQMLDDADATGLTARIPQEGGETPAETSNESRPAE